jgi:hypothetical protein
MILQFCRNAVFKACARTALQNEAKVTMKHFMEAAEEEWNQLPENASKIKDFSLLSSIYQ